MVVRSLPLGFAIVATACVVACGFSGEGSLDDPDAGSGPSPAKVDGADGAPSVDGATPIDGSIPTPTPLPICDPPTCSLPTPPAGWELALLENARTDACPAGFDAADSIESPNAGTNACACSTCVTTGTNCSTGGIPSAYDSGGGACGSSGAQLQTNAGLCFNFSASFSTDARVDAPTAIPGTCTSAASGVKANVTTQAIRVCSTVPAAPATTLTAARTVCCP